MAQLTKYGEEKYADYDRAESASAEVDEQSEIAAMLTALARERMQLGEYLEALDRRLQPVRRRTVPPASDTLDHPEPERSPIGEGLHREVMELQEMRYRLSRMIEALAV